MSYEIIDQSIERGAPLHLFQIYFEGVTYRFCNIPTGVTALGEFWEHKAIKMGQVSATQELNKNNLDLDLAKSDDFARLFISDTQEEPTLLSVYRGHSNDLDFVLYWKGRLASRKVKNSVTLSFESVFTQMRRPGLMGKFSKNCRHALYGRGCNLDPEDFRVDAHISDISADGVILVVPEASAQPDGYYMGGMVRASDGVLRFIKSHTGSQIIINREYSGLVDSGSIGIYPGCDRSLPTCANKFGNNLNHGGFPFVKEKNPFTMSSIV